MGYRPGFTPGVYDQASFVSGRLVITTPSGATAQEMPRLPQTALTWAYALDSQDVTISRAACVLLSAAGRRQAARRILDAMLQQFPSHWSVCATAGRILQENVFVRRGVPTHSLLVVSRSNPIWRRHGSSTAVS